MHKRETFKKGISAQDGARKREDNIVAARKHKREESLIQRRRTQAAVPGGAASDSNAGGSANDRIQHAGGQLFASDSAATMLEGATTLRRLLSIEQNPPIQAVVNTPGLVQRLIELLALDDYPDLQFEACWALTNVASGAKEHTLAVLPAAPACVRLMGSANNAVREQAVWALGNIAGDSVTMRDACLQAGFLPPLLQVLRSPKVATEGAATVPLARTAAWALSNCCRGDALPPMATLLPIYSTLADLVQPITDSEVLADACWALSYLSDGPNDRIQALLDTNVTRRLVDLLSGERAGALVPALRAVANVATGDDMQTQAAVNCGLLLQLQKILARSHLHAPSLVKEACWALSNVTAGTPQQVDAVIASGAAQHLVRLLVDGDAATKREAAWAVSNAASASNPTQCAHLVHLGALRPLSQLLGSMDTRMAVVALEGIRHVLVAGGREDAPGRTADGRNAFADALEGAGGLDALEALQNHTSREVADAAVQILGTFFELDEEENVAPALDGGGNYAFAAPAAAPVSFSEL